MSCWVIMYGVGSSNIYKNLRVQCNIIASTHFLELFLFKGEIEESVMDLLIDGRNHRCCVLTLMLIEYTWKHLS